MPGKSSSDKGKRYEREFVRLVKKQGYEVERIYASGAMGTRLRRNTAQILSGDVYIRDLDLIVEVKYRSRRYPQWIDYLTAPLGIDDEHGNRLLFVPGVELAKLFETGGIVWTANTFSTKYFLELMGKEKVLAVRTPGKRWTLVRRL